jgi:hypothetical protein
MSRIRSAPSSCVISKRPCDNGSFSRTSQSSEGIPAVLLPSASFLRTPMTLLAPICFAIFTAADPTAPVAPSTSTISSGDARPAVTIALHAVRYPRAKAAACSKVSCLGFSTKALTGTETNSACEPFRPNPRLPPVPKLLWLSMPLDLQRRSRQNPFRALEEFSSPKSFRARFWRRLG